MIPLDVCVWDAFPPQLETLRLKHEILLLDIFRFEMYKILSYIQAYTHSCWLFELSLSFFLSEENGACCIIICWNTCVNYFPLVSLGNFSSSSFFFLFLFIYNKAEFFETKWLKWKSPPVI